jgi:hypothetical protein
MFSVSFQARIDRTQDCGSQHLLLHRVISPRPAGWIILRFQFAITGTERTGWADLHLRPDENSTSSARKCLATLNRHL